LLNATASNGTELDRRLPAAGAGFEGLRRIGFEPVIALAAGVEADHPRGLQRAA